MSSNQGGSQGGSGNGRGGGYTYNGSGVNSQGNHYCSRNYGSDAPNPNSYHYSNGNGSYFYSNPNGSAYYNDGKGSGWYAPPSGGQSGGSGSQNSQK